MSWGKKLRHWIKLALSKNERKKRRRNNFFFHRFLWVRKLSPLSSLPAVMLTTKRQRIFQKIYDSSQQKLVKYSTRQHCNFLLNFKFTVTRFSCEYKTSFMREEYQDMSCNTYSPFLDVFTPFFLCNSIINCWHSRTMEQKRCFVNTVWVRTIWVISHS
jgi:hypothetical protein